MFIRADEDGRPPVRGNGLREAVLALEGLGDAKAQQARQLVRRRRRARAREEDDVVGTGMDAPPDGIARLLAERGGHPPGRRDPRVGIPVERAGPVDPALDEPEEAAGRRLVGIEQRPAAEGGLDPRAPPDLGLPDPAKRLLERLHGCDLPPPPDGDHLTDGTPRRVDLVHPDGRLRIMGP